MGFKWVIINLGFRSLNGSSFKTNSICSLTHAIFVNLKISFSSWNFLFIPAASIYSSSSDELSSIFTSFNFLIFLFFLLFFQGQDLLSFLLHHQMKEMNEQHLFLFFLLQLPVIYRILFSQRHPVILKLLIFLQDNNKPLKY